MKEYQAFGKEIQASRVGLWRSSLSCLYAIWCQRAHSTTRPRRAGALIHPSKWVLCVPPVHCLRRAEAFIGKVFGSVSSHQPDIKRTKLHCGTLSAAKRCTKSPDVVSPLMRRTISEFDGGHVSKVHTLPAGLNGTDGGDIEPSRLRPVCSISGLTRFWLMTSYTSSLTPRRARIHAGNPPSTARGNIAMIPELTLHTLT